MSADRDWLTLLSRDAWPEPWRSMPAWRPVDSGESSVIPRIDWALGEPVALVRAHARWDTAVQSAASTGDVAGLIDLLRSDAPLCRDSRDLLAELFAKRQIKALPGPRTMPGRITLAEGQLYDQAARYRFYRRRGLDHDDALHAALVSFLGHEIGMMLGEERPSDDELAEMVTDEQVERLDSHIRGRRGASRRRWRRRPKNPG